MNREIKFRVWDIQDRCFCYCGNGNFYTGDSESRMLDGIPRFMGKILFSSGFHYKEGKDKRPIYNSSFESNRYFIQQFTGLLDKNNKEIYEGDILKWYGSKYQINYADACFEAQEISVEPEDGPCFLFDINRKSRIIGNIFENPELLEQTKV